VRKQQLFYSLVPYYVWRDQSKIITRCPNSYLRNSNSRLTDEKAVEEKIDQSNNRPIVNSYDLHGKNGFAERSKIFCWIQIRKVILLNHQKNVERSN